MDTRVDEIADGIYRIATFTSEIPPRGFTFNQFVIDAEEPLIFHTGQRNLFPIVSEAVAKVVPLERLRWITFGHLESDESGGMNQFLAAAPKAEVAHGVLGCIVSLNDLADRPPRMLGDGEVLDLGGKRVRNIDTPHVPHNWEARILFEETTGTLLCGDLGTQLGDGPPLVDDGDLVERAIEAEEAFHATSNAASTASTMRTLADLDAKTLGIMHGSSFNGDCAGALRDMADAYEQRYATPG
jgi:flavorubredoxin